jgi:hypothetical protein
MEQHQFFNKFSVQFQQFVFTMFRGCRAQKLISEFTYNDVTGTADANIFSMFRSAHLKLITNVVDPDRFIPDPDFTF